MKETDLAWAAGFVDGEGTFCSWATTRKGIPNPQRRINFSVGQAGNKELLHRLYRILKTGVITQRKQKDGFLPMFILTITGYRRTIKVAELLWPYLGNIKRRQFLKAVEKYEAHKLTGRSRVENLPRPCLRIRGSSKEL